LLKIKSVIMGQPQNTEKNRKSDAQEVFEQAENAGRFAGNDNDANAAKTAAQENIRQDVNSSREERSHDQTDAEARRDPAQSQDYKGESQNVNDDNGRPLTSGDELDHARNKANEGKDETAGIP
jgi:hypothetical protein